MSKSLRNSEFKRISWGWWQGRGREGGQLFRLHTSCTNYLPANIYPRQLVKRKTWNKSWRWSRRDGHRRKKKKNKPWKFRHIWRHICKWYNNKWKDKLALVGILWTGHKLNSGRGKCSRDWISCPGERECTFAKTLLACGINFILFTLFKDFF